MAAVRIRMRIESVSDCTRSKSALLRMRGFILCNIRKNVCNG